MTHHQTVAAQRIAADRAELIAELSRQDRQRIETEARALRAENARRAAMARH